LKNDGMYHSLLVSQRDISRYKKIILTDRFNVGMIIMKASLAESLVTGEATYKIMKNIINLMTVIEENA